jgi:HD-like signal output (HDOD) protein
VLNKKSFHPRTRREAIIDRQPLQMDADHDLPDVPVLPETLLLLDLLVQEPCVDLGQMSRLVLADVGASVQLLRLAGREYGMAEGRPTRIADCISDLGLRACLKALSARTISNHARKHEIAAFWDHSRDVANHARQIAQEMLETDPEDAYMVGLCHGIGSLPELLGWRESGVADSALAGLRLAKRWSLPQCVTEFFTEMQLPGYGPRWSGLIQKAHSQAKRVSSYCPFEAKARPQLCRDSHERLG